MDTSNWRPALAETSLQQQPSSIDGGDDDWRSELQPESRQRIINKIMETLKRHLPFSGQEGLQELKKIAIRFEEKIYSGASNQSDYLRKISLKMLTMETKSQNPNPMANSMPSNSIGNSKNPADSASQNMQSQLHGNLGQSVPIQLTAANQSQTRNQMLSQQNIQNMASTVTQSSGGIQSAMPSSVTTALNNQAPTLPNIAAQNSNVPSNVTGNSMVQQGVMPSNVFVANSQRQMQQGGRQQLTPQNSQYLYQQQMQQQFMKQKLQQQQGNSNNNIQQMQQPQQQNILQSTSQLNSSQPSNNNNMQPASSMQSSGGIQSSAPLSGLHQNQQSQSALLQQHPQSVLRQPLQATSMHPQQTSMLQQPLLPSQQLIGQQQNATTLPQNQLLGQPSNITDMQQQQQQQRLLNQQNNLPNLQQQLMAQQNNLLGSQSNQSGSQQSGNPGMQINQHSIHMMPQSKVPQQQQTHQAASNLLQTQGQQPQQQQPHLISQNQSQSNHLQQLNMQQQQQQQLNLQQQLNPLQRGDIQQRLQTSNAMLQPNNVIDQQKQLFQSQRNLPEVSSSSVDSTGQTGNANGGDWQEEIYQKIKTLKEMYFPELNELYQKISAKFAQHDALPQQQPKSEHIERLRGYKTMLEHIVSSLQISKNNITPNFRDKMPGYEKQILSLLSTNRPRKLMPQGQQLPPPHMNSLQSSQQAQSQIAQQHEVQSNPQMQTMNLQHGSNPSLSTAPNAQQSMMNSLQSGSNLDSLQQNSVSAQNQTIMNALSSQGGINAVQQPNNNIMQTNSNMLQHQHMKQQQEQQMMQAQQMKQFQQRQMQQQLIQKQQIIQQQQQQQHQLHQQQTKQQPTQSHQIPQLNQMSDNDLKSRQGMGVKSGVFIPPGQRAAYQQQLKNGGGPFPITSPQLLQASASSPQIHQHSSPQIEQQNILSSITKANSSFAVPSPQTPTVPSPLPGDSDKHGSGVTSLTNTAHQQVNGTLPPSQSLAIGTPGISASPLLAEFSSQDGNHVNVTTAISGKSNATEQPLERLVRLVKSISPKALEAAISDIGSVVSMIDMIGGSAPGNGSRATVGEDLVAMTKCRLQAKNFITHEGTTGTKRMRRYTSAMPLVVASSFDSANDSSKQLTNSKTFDLDSTATFRIKRPRIEVNHTLLEEIRKINQRLIDTVVSISNEDDDPTATAGESCEGTIVKCSFIAVSLCPNLKSLYDSAQMTPVQPLRLLVPTNYPECSPVLLDKFPVEASTEHEDLSVKAKSRFKRSLRSLQEPMSLGEIAKTWDACARAVISEFAQQSGGGTFTSTYGSWESCLTST